MTPATAMTSDPAMSPSADAAATEEPSQFTLQILSPSVNVPQPLFLTLPVTTTVRQLKERIRGCVGTKPPDDAQRLIHRGRLLARDSETMLELFGEEPLRSAERQTLHLVLRDLSEGQRSTPPLSYNQPAGSRAQTPGHQHAQQQPHPQHHAQFMRFSPHPNIAFGNPQAPGALNGTQLPPGITPQQLLQNQFQVMARLGLANQNQNPIFNPMAQQGVQNRGAPGTTTPNRTASPFQPETTRTVIREGIGPDGQRWRFTVNESIVTTAPRPGRTGSPFSSAEASTTPTIPQPRSVPLAGPPGAHDLPTLFRTPDADSATRAMADAMRRNASSSSLANLASYQSQQPIPPGVTTPLIPSRNGSAAGTPDPFQASGRSVNTSAGIHASQPSATPEVYILSSPSGPRAILLNGSLGTYYSPQLRSYQPIGLPPLPTSFGVTPGNLPQMRREALPHIIPRSSIANRHQPGPHSNNPPPGQQPQIQPPHELQVPGPLQAQLGHGMDNAQIQAIRMIQVWPHVWMIIRLALFIWWFTSPTSSWSRWITVVSIAITLFIVNTGILNPFAEQMWIPLRRHLENLIPLAADADGRQQRRPAAENAQGADANGANPGRRDPNPADAAARLVQQRQQDNANWLLNQARRLERAGILFIASLAPGLAERHIAQVEAEARAAERQREQEAETAAAAAAAAQPPSEHADDNPTSGSSESHGSPSDGDPPNYEPGSSHGTTGPNTKTPAQEPRAT